VLKLEIIYKEFMGLQVFGKNCKKYLKIFR